MKIVILGLMAAGKTAVGEELARRLGLPFSDSDRTILATTRKTARLIQTEEDISQVHSLEAEHLLQALDSPDPAIIAAAASVVDDELCRRALRRRNVVAIWLRARPETLAARIFDGTHRPDFGDPAEFFQHQSVSRSPHLHRLSSATIDVDDLPLSEIVEAVELVVRARVSAADVDDQA